MVCTVMSVYFVDLCHGVLSAIIQWHWACTGCAMSSYATEITVDIGILLRTFSVCFVSLCLFDLFM